MTAEDQAAAIAAAVRASLSIAAENGMTIEQFLAESGDRAIGNNAAMALQIEEE